MNLRSLAVLAVLANSACVIVATPRAKGDVTFLWSFDGQGCSMVPAVKNVKIIIPGQSLMNEGVFDCSTNGTAGIVLHDFTGGVYTYTLQGRDYNGTVLYSKDGSFTVDGPTTVNVNLNPVGGGGHFAYLVWTFPPSGTTQNPDCTQAGVTKVRVTIDNAAVTPDYNCADGNTAQGTQSPYLSDGTHTITLSAVNSDGYEYYALTSTLPISATASVQQYDLNWTVGGTALKWTLQSNGFVTDCVSAGITDMYVNFRDSQMNFVYPGSGAKVPCGNGTAGMTFDYIRAGTYAVFLQASGTGASTWQSDQASPGMITISAGVFAPVTGAPNVIVNKQ